MLNENQSGMNIYTLQILVGEDTDWGSQAGQCADWKCYARLFPNNDSIVSLYTLWNFEPRTQRHIICKEKKIKGFETNSEKSDNFPWYILQSLVMALECHDNQGISAHNGGNKRLASLVCSFSRLATNSIRLRCISARTLLKLLVCILWKRKKIATHKTTLTIVSLMSTVNLAVFCRT